MYKVDDEVLIKDGNKYIKGYISNVKEFANYTIYTVNYKINSWAIGSRRLFHDDVFPVINDQYEDWED